MVSSLPPWRAFVRRYVIALGISFVLITTGLFVGNRVIDDKLSDIPRVGKLVLADGPGKAGNYLLIGSDSRVGLDNPGAFGTEAETGPPKSDTLMLIHIDPEAKTSLLVSFPRDLLVNVPGHGQAQINSAFNDGQQKVIDTIQQNFDVPVNHYVEVNFTAFEGIVDAIGKIPVYFQAPARDAYSGLNITTPGCVDLNGNQALQYVRARHLEYYESGRWEDASPRADLDRIVRQQNFIRRLAAVAASKSASNPLTVLEVADAVVPKLKFDRELGKEDIFRLVNTFRKVNPNDDSSVEMLTIPVEESKSQPGRVVLKQPDAESVLSRLRTFGTPDVGNFSKLLPAQVRVRILNASGVLGAAGQALAQFQQYSFAPAGVGNTSLKSNTEIHYRPGNEGKALLVAQYMNGVGRVVSDSSITDADVVVMIAKDFTGLVKPGKKGSASTTTTTTGSSDKKTTTTTAPQATGC